MKKATNNNLGMYRSKFGVSEFVYVMSNIKMPGLIKVGKTYDCVHKRASSLYTTGVPVPFTIEFYIETDNCSLLEKKVHTILNKYRVPSNREFFTISPLEALSIIKPHITIERVKMEPRFKDNYYRHASCENVKTFNNEIDELENERQLIMSEIDEHRHHISSEVKRLNRLMASKKSRVPNSKGNNKGREMSSVGHSYSITQITLRYMYGVIFALIYYNLGVVCAFLSFILMYVIDSEIEQKINIDMLQSKAATQPSIPKYMNQKVIKIRELEVRLQLVNGKISRKTYISQMPY